MMTFRSRLTVVCGVLAVLVILLVLGIAFSPARVHARAAGRPLLSGAAIDRVVGVDILFGGHLKVSLRRAATGWVVPAGDKPYPASADRVTTFLRTVTNLARSSLVTRDAAHLAELGLSPDSARRIVLHQAQGGPDLALEVGARGPSGEADYVRLPNEPAVYLARGSVSFFLSPDPTPWYDLHVLPDDVLGDTVASVTVQGTLDLGGPGGARGGSYTLRRPSALKPDEWSIEGSPAPVDRVAAGAMASAVAGLEGVAFADASDARPAVDGQIRMTVGTLDGRTYVVNVRLAQEPGKLLVTSDWSPWAWIVTTAALRRAVLPQALLTGR